VQYRLIPVLLELQDPEFPVVPVLLEFPVHYRLIPVLLGLQHPEFPVVPVLLEFLELLYLEFLVVLAFLVLPVVLDYL
jgi:hypothetical protein